VCFIQWHLLDTPIIETHTSNRYYTWPTLRMEARSVQLGRKVLFSDYSSNYVKNYTGTAWAYMGGSPDRKPRFL